MTHHRAIVEVGPGTVRRLCCRTSTVADRTTSELIRAALDGIDDQVALVGERPVAVDSLWGAALGSVLREGPAAHETMILVYPSWWSSSRVGVLTAAAAAVADNVLAQPRSWLLAHASDAVPEATVAVEIAERLVAITGTGMVAVPRSTEPHPLAGEVAHTIAEMAAAVVLIDAPDTVAGAPALARAIAEAVRRGGRTVVRIDDARLARLAVGARSAEPAQDKSSGSRSTATAGGRRRPRTYRGLGAAAIVLAAAAPALVTAGRHGPIAAQRVRTAATTSLVEGRVTLTVPANWPTQRVVSGSGSPRVQVTSPSDPEVALHITQSPVAGDTLSGTADRLKRAIDAEPAGVFVDFNPSGSSAGRPAVTYREVRASHHVRWTVLLDGPVRISVGCQSRPGDENAVRGVCEEAVRSAHALG